MVDFTTVATNAGFDEAEAFEILEYFRSENFFNDITVVWEVSLSHRAIVEIENSVKNPQQSTEHFSSTVIQNFNAPVGAVQTGNNNIANVNQNIGQNFSEILEQLALLKENFNRKISKMKMTKVKKKSQLILFVVWKMKLLKKNRIKPK